MLHCQSRRTRVVERKGTVNGFDHIFSRIVQQDCAGQGGQQGTAFLFTEIADDQAGFHIRFPRGRKHSRELFVIAVGDTYDAFVTFRGEQTHQRQGKFRVEPSHSLSAFPCDDLDGTRMKLFMKRRLPSGAGRAQITEARRNFKDTLPGLLGNRRELAQRTADGHGADAAFRRNGVQRDAVLFLFYHNMVKISRKR